MSKETEQIILAIEVAARMITSELILLRRSISKQFEKHDTDLRTVIESVDGKVGRFIGIVEPLATLFTGEQDGKSSAESRSVQEPATVPAEPVTEQTNIHAESDGSGFAGIKVCVCCPFCPSCTCTEHKLVPIFRSQYAPGNDPGA